MDPEEPGQYHHREGFPESCHHFGVPADEFYFQHYRRNHIVSRPYPGRLSPLRRNDLCRPWGLGYIIYLQAYSFTFYKFIFHKIFIIQQNFISLHLRIVTSFDTY